LSILFHENGFFYITKKDKTTNYESVIYQNNANFLENIKKKIDEIKELQDIFDNVEVVFHNNLFTVVPNAYFDEQNIENYLQLNASIQPNDPFRYNVDLTNKCVVAFSYLEELERFLEKKYSRIRYFHSLFKFMENLNQQKLDVEFHLNFYKNSFEMVSFKNNQLFLINTFQFTTQQEILSYLDTIFELNNITKSEVPLYFYGVLNPQEEIIVFLKSHFAKLKPGILDKYKREYVCLN